MHIGSGPCHGVHLPKYDPKASATTTTTKLRDKKVAPLSVTWMSCQIYKVVMDDGEYQEIFKKEMIVGQNKELSKNDIYKHNYMGIHTNRQ